MSKSCIIPNSTETPDEILKSLAAREGDITGMNFMKYRGVVMDVWRDLKLYAIKYTKRAFIQVDKKTNSITMPDDFLFRSSLSILDDCNKLQLLSINQDLHDDIIDISLDHDCHCECGCKSDLCGQIKSYEAITEDTQELMPDDSYQTFTSVTRKRMDAGGRFVIERTFPVRVYTGGEWTGVELKTETEELCHLDTNPCGCVKNTTDNQCKVDGCCNADFFKTECGSYLCPTPGSMGYNISEEGNRIVLPSTFNRDKVLVRYYAEDKMKDIRVPLIAKKAFIFGVKSFIMPFDESQPLWRVRLFDKYYTDSRADLFTKLNGFTIRELKQVLSPKRFMP